MKTLRYMLALLLTVSMTISSSACSKTPEDSAEIIPNASEINHHLKIVADYDTMRWGCSTSKGYYDSIMWPFDMYEERSAYIHISNLVYTDYASHTRVYLCNTPGCAHNNENCTSFIKYSAGLELFCDANEKYLFCISSGAVHGEYEYEEEIGSIMRCDLDGSNRIELIKLDPTENFNWYGQVFSDDEYIYISVFGIDPNSNEVTKSLKRIDIETGENENIYTGPVSVFFRSVVDGEYILVEDGTDPKGMGIYRFSPYDLSMQRVDWIEWPNAGEPLLSGGRWFRTGEYVDIQAMNEPNTIRCVLHDYSSNTESAVENIPINAAGGVFPHAYNKPLNLLSIGYIDADTEDHKEICIDFNDNGYSERNLIYINTSYNMPIQIISEYDDKYMVIIGESEKKTITQVDQNGVAHTYEYEGRPLYATMLKEDYWNQNPVYEIIDDQI